MNGAITQQEAQDRMEEIATLRVELDAEYADLQAVIRAIGRRQGAPAGANEHSDYATYPGVSIDFSEASNLRERIVRIARVVSGPLHTMDMANCLVERGASNVIPSNLRSHIINLLRDDPDFPKVAESTYKYVPQK